MTRFSLVLFLMLTISCSDSKSKSQDEQINADDADLTAIADTDPHHDEMISDTDNDSISDNMECGINVVEDIAIEMRDGKTLAATVVKREGCRMPVILIQTPYNRKSFVQIYLGDNRDEHPLFSSRDYAYVVVDWRGFHGSKDAFIAGAQQPYGQDGYDIVEWIAQQDFSNGKTGMWGVSALCGQQYRTAVMQPPHLTAAVPIFCQANNSYSQYYPGGVLRKEFYDFISGYFGGGVVMDHPTRDFAWQYADNLIDLSRVEIPMLVVGGLYDLYNKGTLEDFNKLVEKSETSVRGEHRMLFGPWIHFAVGGATGNGAGRELTEQEMKYVDANMTIEQKSREFLDYHLLGKGTASPSSIMCVQGGDRRQVSFDSWPPSEVLEMHYYLKSDQTLGLDQSSGTIELGFDPLDPSPTTGGMTLSSSMQHGPMDQQPVIERDDTAVFVTTPFEKDFTIAGEIVFTTDIQTTGKDTDVALRLTDVDENGTHLLINEGIQRLKLRDDFAKVSPVTAGEKYTVTLTMPNELIYTFKKEHRLGIILTSGNYPRFDANPGTGADFLDFEENPVSVTNTFYLENSLLKVNAMLVEKEL